MEELSIIKESLAKEKGYETWAECLNAHPNCMVETLMDIVALRFRGVTSWNSVSEKPINHSTVVSNNAFKDELLRKTESMIWFARENYNKEYYEGVLNAMRNMQVHIKKIYKKHSG